MVSAYWRADVAPSVVPSFAGHPALSAHGSGGGVSVSEVIVEDQVGPLLSLAGGRAILVVSAIRDDNPGTDIEAVDCGECVRVRAPGFLRVTRQTLQWHLGRSFALSTLRSMVLSCAGQMIELGDELQWRGDATPWDPGRGDPR